MKKPYKLTKKKHPILSALKGFMAAVIGSKDAKVKNNVHNNR